MIKDDITDPPGITIRGNNWFHEGWIHGLLGLPFRTFANFDQRVKDIDIESYDLGYQTAIETRSLDNVRWCCEKMRRMNQIIIEDSLK